MLSSLREESRTGSTKGIPGMVPRRSYEARLGAAISRHGGHRFRGQVRADGLVDRVHQFTLHDAVLQRGARPSAAVHGVGQIVVLRRPPTALRISKSVNQSASRCQTRSAVEFFSLEETFQLGMAQRSHGVTLGNWRGEQKRACVNSSQESARRGSGLGVYEGRQACATIGHGATVAIGCRGRSGARPEQE